MVAMLGRLRYASAISAGDSIFRKCMSSGFATPEGTRSFFLKEGVDLSLHHRFEVSGLFVNPIIHGPPLRRLSKRKEEIYMLQALSKHKSNAFFVYDHYTGTYGSCLQREEETAKNKRESWTAKSFEKILEIAGIRGKRW
jgi:hypothetical protein